MFSNAFLPVNYFSVDSSVITQALEKGSGGHRTDICADARRITTTQGALRRLWWVVGDPFKSPVAQAGQLRVLSGHSGKY